MEDETSELISQNHPDRMESITEGMKLITCSRMSTFRLEQKALKFENMRSTTLAKGKTH